MQTVASLSDKFDMSAEEAVEKLNYMGFEVEGTQSPLTDELFDLLLEVEDDPDVVEKVRQENIKKKERASKAAKKAAATRKAAAKKSADAKKKRDEKKQAEEEAAAQTAAAASPHAEILAPAPKTARDGAAESFAEILPLEEAAERTAEAVKTPKKKKAEKAEPSIIIGSAIEHEQHRAEIVRADGTHLGIEEVEELPLEVPVESVSEEEEPRGLLAEAERRQEEEDRRKAKHGKPAVKPDPAVVAEVIRKADVQRRKEAARQREQGEEAEAYTTKDKKRKAKARAAAAGTRRTGKTARKRQKELEKHRKMDRMRQEAAAAVKLYQASGEVSPAKKKRKKRTRDEESTSISDNGAHIIEVEDAMTVDELARVMEMDPTDIIIELMDHNVMATKNQNLSLDLIRQLAEPKGYEVVSVIPEEQVVLAEEPDDPEKLRPRAPVVTVMGHVDHGKTSLLDQVRKASVAAGEAGGITQHIAAYEVKLPQGKVVFLDTPGHEAFTAMRARGAHVTDVVVLVVAADDGIMPQTIEAIDHAKAAEVPIVVAVNKIDKPNAQPDRIRQELTRFDLTDEKWGGKTIIRDISALTGQGVDELMELLVLETEMLELRANPDKRARGAIIEAEITRGQGPVAWVLVRTGTLRVGDSFLAGETFGRVRAMQNSAGENVREAGPSTPVVVMGFDEPPHAGDQFIAVADERLARAIAEKRGERSRMRSGPAVRHVTLEDFHAQLLAGEKHELNIVVKADVQGSVDVLQSSIPKMGNDEVRAKIVHSGVGSINESDVLLASASDAVIIGFHVEASPKVEKMAHEEGVTIRTYRIIYEAIEEIRKALEGLLEPEQRELITGHAEIRAVFRSSALGAIAGCYVQDGEIRRDASIRLVRGGNVVYTGRINSLRREKDTVSSVQQGYECGIKLEGTNDIQEGDVIEAYRFESIAKTLA
ncbi:MAG: translation initiation factor IF-2 [Candidatus Hydrogenedentales bacterium]